jgi:hypothetical protein
LCIVNNIYSSEKDEIMRRNLAMKCTNWKISQETFQLAMQPFHNKTVLRKENKSDDIERSYI